MRSVDRGHAGEALVLAALLASGCRVLLPFGDGHAFDLALVTDDTRFLRVQCKVARRKGGCLEFNSSGTDHGRGAQSYVGRADVFGVAHLSTSTVYLVPVTEAQATNTYLRLEPTLNNQVVGVRMAADYTIERQLPALLGELAA
jgi:hypothetical protein